MMKKILFCALLTLLSGCIACLELPGLVRHDYAGDRAYTSLKDARQNERAIGTLTFDQRTILQINNDSPHIDYAGKSGRFEMFSLKGEEYQRFTLYAGIELGCFASRKTATVITIYLLDSVGNIVESGGYYYKNAPLDYVWGEFPATGDYYFVVIAKNNEGKAIEPLRIAAGSP